MTPEKHVTGFLEQAKERYSSSAWIMRRAALNRYLEYLRLQAIETIPAGIEFIDQYRVHLCHERAHHRKTVWLYLSCLKDFYEHLKIKGIVQENPVKSFSLRRAPLKDRYYTDEEIWRAYLANWRKIYGSPARIDVLARSWKKIQKILGQLSLRLQALNGPKLDQICIELDRYRSLMGTRLCRGDRQEALSILKGILRWMHRNGYIKEDLSWGLGFSWTMEESTEKIASPFGAIPAPCQVDGTIDPVWEEHQTRYLEAMQVKLKKSTCDKMKQNLKWFWRHLSGLKIKDIHQISKEVLENYRAKICQRKNLAQSTRCNILGVSCTFMNWLEKTDQILINPCHRIIWPKRTRGLPTRLMSEHDVKILINAPDIKTPFGLRARAVFELMYSTGARAGEASGVRIEDIDFENGLLKIQNPKGGPNYQRVVPIGQTALLWIKKYLSEARDLFSPERGYERLLFLSQHGGPISANIISSAMKYHGIKQGMRKIYSSHSWRVTCATAMLRNQADIRHVQEQLGHRSLDSTQRYTRLFPMDLKRVHQKTHPREREARRNTSK